MIEIHTHGEQSTKVDIDFKLTNEIKDLTFGELSEEQIALLHDLADGKTVSADASKAILTALYNLWDLQSLLGDYAAQEHKNALVKGRRRRTE